MQHRLPILAVTLLLAGSVASVQAQELQVMPADGTQAATMINHPRVIRDPGNYRLARSLQSDAARTIIQIEASDVTLDLGGFTLTGPGSRQGIGISVVGASNVKIFNGHIQRLGIGISTEGATNVVIEDLQIDGIDSGGAPPDVEIGVLLVNTRGARVMNNVVTNTFLGIFVRGDGSSGNRIYGNLLTGGDNGELAICYNPAPGSSVGGPHGDLVTHNSVARFRRGLSLSPDSTGNVVRENTLAYFDIGIQEGTADSNLLLANDTIQISR
ncbi:MAG: NosD domain-containing protein [Thermoanaerobaculia bacterium]